VRDALDERELELADLCSDKTHIWEDDPDARKKNYENALAHLKRLKFWAPGSAH